MKREKKGEQFSSLRIRRGRVLTKGVILSQREYLFNRCLAERDSVGKKGGNSEVRKTVSNSLPMGKK